MEKGRKAHALQLSRWIHNESSQLICPKEPQIVRKSASLYHAGCGREAKAQPRPCRPPDAPYVRTPPPARVGDLAPAFHVSVATIRQDVERREAYGHIIREHCGA